MRIGQLDSLSPIRSTAVAILDCQSVIEGLVRGISVQCPLVVGILRELVELIPCHGTRIGSFSIQAGNGIVSAKIAIPQIADSPVHVMDDTVRTIIFVGRSQCSVD